MNLQAYLPSSLDVNECIKPEAEGSDEAVLLAVHRPSKLAYRFVNRPDLIATTEDELLNHVLTDNVPTGALVVPITGISGVGKSHLVRILNARLRQRADSGRFLIARVPKSASLRRVVQLILDLLPHEQRFADVRTAFDRAMGEVDLQSATVDFGSCLIVALEQRAKSLSERFTSGEAALGPELDHCRRVHLLFQDPVTGKHFRDTVFPRILKRALSEKSTEEVDALSGQFTPADLVLPPSINYNDASSLAQKYYTLAVNQASGRGRDIAAKVLNEVVDEATRRLFKLHDSLGGMTLQEVILEIRSVLLKQARELILLIEDFAALTGIQETLSKVLIQEGVRDGKQVYATMRSVIAVTDGWTIGRETIATRAEREWIVESQIESETEILALTRSMVAAYLNAARYGQANLIKLYQSSNQMASSKWLDTFRSDEDDDATADLLTAFGTENSIPLFPFTSTAIERLARIALTEGQRLVFRPRYIITQVLRNTLLTARDLFKNKEFPPPSMDPREPSAPMADLIQAQPESIRGRYSTVLTVWGNAPQDVDALMSRIPPGVFQAFSLPVPRNLSCKPKPRTKSAPATPVTPIDSPVIRRLDSKIDAFQLALETWIQDNQRLPQDPAAKIRALVAEALSQRIDANAERCRDTTVSANQISIPNAAGEHGLTANPIVLSADAKDRDGRLRRGLVALYRMSEAQKNKEVHPELEEDLARGSNVIDSLVPQALARIRAKASEQCAFLAVPLAMSGRVLGLGDANKSPRTIRKVLLQTVHEHQGVTDEGGQELREWRALQAECLATRSILLSKLQNWSGCFQGTTGHKVLALDIVRVTNAYSQSSDSKDSSAGSDSLTNEELQAVRVLAEPKVRQRANLVLNKFRAICKIIETDLGADFDKHRVLESVLGLADVFKGGRWATERVEMTYPEFLTLCEAFRSLPVKDSLNQFAEASADDPKSGRAIARVSQIDFNSLVVAHRFVTAVGALASYGVQNADLLDRQYGDLNPTEEARSINGLFAQLTDMLKIKEGGE